MRCTFWLSCKPVDAYCVADDQHKRTSCKCSKHKIPLLHDVEFDYFLHRVVPIAQLVVVCITNSLHHGANPYDTMLEYIYVERNK